MTRAPFALSALLASVTLLAACTSEPVRTSENLETLLENPLYAERYFKDLVTTMVDMEIHEQRMLTGSGLEATVVRAKERALERAKMAEAQTREGLIGSFVPAKEEPIGQVLLLGTKLYMGSDFSTEPGPNLHVYLSTLIDPRDITFPDEAALHLGPLKNAYGAQNYDVTTTQDAKTFRTVVLYDQALKRVYGFAQISPQ